MTFCDSKTALISEIVTYSEFLLITINNFLQKKKETKEFIDYGTEA